MFNRWFPEITGEIIWKSEAPAVGHRFTHRLLAYIGPWFQNGGSSRKALVSDLQAWTYTILDCQMALYTRNTFFFFFFYSRVLVFLAGPHAMCLFGMADWLNRLWVFIIYTAFLIKKKKRKNKNKFKKIIGSLCWLTLLTHTSSGALHGLPEADHCKQRIEYRTRNSETSYSIPSLTSDCG